MPIPILDPQRIQRRPGRQIRWECSLKTRMRFRSMLQELVDLEQYPPSETREAMEALREDIRALPGFPVGYDPERDLIVPVTTSAQR
jgi:hypothetical protein